MQGVSTKGSVWGTGDTTNVLTKDKDGVVCGNHGRGGVAHGMVPYGDPMKALVITGVGNRDTHCYYYY